MVVVARASRCAVALCGRSFAFSSTRAAFGTRTSIAARGGGRGVSERR